MPASRVGTALYRWDSAAQRPSLGLCRTQGGRKVTRCRVRGPDLPLSHGAVLLAGPLQEWKLVLKDGGVKGSWLGWGPRRAPGGAWNKA